MVRLRPEIEPHRFTLGLFPNFWPPSLGAVPSGLGFTSGTHTIRNCLLFYLLFLPVPNAVWIFWQMCTVSVPVPRSLFDFGLRSDLSASPRPALPMRMAPSLPLVARVMGFPGADAPALAPCHPSPRDQSSHFPSDGEDSCLLSCLPRQLFFLLNEPWLCTC